eukprot:COSAG06_NODE_12106_length_1423_cov_1.362538_1_plen_141_part_00
MCGEQTISTSSVAPPTADQPLSDAEDKQIKTIRMRKKKTGAIHSVQDEVPLKAPERACHGALCLHAPPSAVLRATMAKSGWRRALGGSLRPVLHARSRPSLAMSSMFCNDGDCRQADLRVLIVYTNTAVFCTNGTKLLGF